MCTFVHLFCLSFVMNMYTRLYFTFFGFDIYLELLTGNLINLIGQCE